MIDPVYILYCFVRLVYVRLAEVSLCVQIRIDSQFSLL